MITRLYMQMYRGYVTMPIDNSNDDVIDDVTMHNNV